MHNPKAVLTPIGRSVGSPFSCRSTRRHARVSHEHGRGPVMIGKMPAARVLDTGAHGGTIPGDFTVMIG